MKIYRTAIFLLMAAVMLMSQTLDLGQNVFYNDEGPINLAVDAAVASRTLDGSYVMFVVYMGADQDLTASIKREDLVLIYNDKEYKMPNIKEFREEYSQDRRDINLYSRLGKESLVMSRMRFYRFFWDYDFFPTRGSGIIKTDEGSISSTIGFKTIAYFKNPGFKAGDTITIKVLDRKNPDMWGAAAVIL